jgi:hypothetical protein
VLCAVLLCVPIFRCAKASVRICTEGGGDNVKNDGAVGFVSEGVERSTESAKTEYEVAEKQVMGPYLRGAELDNIRNILKNFDRVKKQNRIAGKP